MPLVFCFRLYCTAFAFLSTFGVALAAPAAPRYGTGMSHLPRGEIMPTSGFANSGWSMAKLDIKLAFVVGYPAFAISWNNRQVAFYRYVKHYIKTRTHHV
jgi:hypothetical protein